MSRSFRWLVVAPVVLFVTATLLMSSCGGSSGCQGSFDEFGNFLPGVCPTPGPHVGFSIETIVIGNGTPIPATPTPSPTPTGGKVRSPTPTATQTLVAQASPTAVTVGNQVGFNASAELVHGFKTMVEDITTRGSTLWTSSNNDILQPPGSAAMGGIYTGVTSGCACIDASSGGISADPVSVSVANVAATPPPCPVCPTIVPTATATARGHTPFEGSLQPPPAPSARINGVLQWTFQAVSPITSQLVPAPDGSLYFITADGNLHNLDAKGRERWSRPATGAGLAVSPDAIVYALGIDGTLIAQSAIGKPQWRIEAAPGFGPLAASSSAVYFQEDRQLIAAAAASGAVLWRSSAPIDLTTAAISDDGTIIVAADSGSIAAFASDGKPGWIFTPEGGFAGAIATRAGVAYVGSGTGRLYALDVSSGTVQWTHDSVAAIGGGPVLNEAGPIFFGSDAIYALNADGSMAWSKPLTKAVSSPLASDGAGGLFASFDNGVSAMLDTDGVLKWTSGSFGRVERAVVSPSGILYVESQGTIYAVK